MMQEVTGLYWSEVLNGTHLDVLLTLVFQVVDIEAKLAEYYDSFHNDHPSYWAHIR